MIAEDHGQFGTEADGHNNRCGTDDVRQYVGQPASDPRCSTGQQRKEDGTNAVDISSSIDLAPTSRCLFRSHERRSPFDLGGPWCMLGQRAGEAKIGNPDTPILTEEKIRWLQIAMNDSHGVGMFECTARFDAPLDGILHGDTSCLDNVIQIGTVHEVHDDEIRTSRGPTQAPVRDDTRVMQFGDGSRLAARGTPHR
jgi:hypothetical protein